MHTLSLTNTRASRLHKAFANNSLANTKLSKIQLHKTRQSAGVLGRLLGKLLKISKPLIKNVLTPSPRTVLIPLDISIDTQWY